MSMLANWVKQSTSTTGTGTIALGSAEAGRIAVGDAFADGDTVRYVIEDGNNREEGMGVYSSSGPTLTRAVVIETLVSGTYDRTSPAAINLSGSATVSCAATANSFLPLMPVTPSPVADIHIDAFVAGTNLSYDATANRLAYTSFTLLHRLEGVIRFGVPRMTAVGTAAKFRLGIYTMGSDGRPDQLIAQTGDITPTAAYSVSATVASFDLEPGTYFIAYIDDGACSVYGHRTVDVIKPFMPYAADGARAATYYETIAGWSAMPASASETLGREVYAAPKIYLATS